MSYLDDLQKATERRFRFLIDEHEFEAPEVRVRARELSLGYGRGGLTIWINYEAGCNPWVTVRPDPDRPQIGFQFYAAALDEPYELESEHAIERAGEILAAHAGALTDAASPLHAAALRRQQGYRPPARRPEKMSALADACLRRFTFLETEHEFDEPEVFVVHEVEHIDYLKPLVTLSFRLSRDGAVSMIVTSQRQHPLELPRPVHGEDGLELHASFFESLDPSELTGEPGMLERLDELWRSHVA